MKAVRTISVVLAVALAVTAFLPFAATPAAAQNLTVVAGSPLQSFMNATRGLPLLAPMSLSAPLVTLSVEKTAGTADYGCTLVRQSPADYTKMQSRQDFDMSWTVQNTGLRMWHTNYTTFAYMGGSKMQTYGNSYGISNDVAVGKRTTLVIDMSAPKAKGLYTTVWGMYSGAKAFCRVTLIIVVNRY